MKNRLKNAEGHYKCCKCCYKFTLKPHKPTPCIKCGNIYIKYSNHDGYYVEQPYVKWLNYEELFGNKSLQELMELSDEDD